MALKHKVINWVLRRVFQSVCRVDMSEAHKIPNKGPYILVGNHINFLETPVALAHLDNPLITGMAKKESWDNPLFHFLFNQWEIIALDRDNLDREAFRQSLEALNAGKMLAIFPEGTRDRGSLLQAKPGVTALVARSQAPIVPVGFFGYENFWPNLKRLRRSDFHMRVGKPFRLNLSSSSLPKEDRQPATDEIMYKIAELLPERYRGYYQFNNPVEYRYAVPLS